MLGNVSGDNGEGSLKTSGVITKKHAEGHLNRTCLHHCDTNSKIQLHILVSVHEDDGREKKEEVVYEDVFA